MEGKSIRRLRMERGLSQERFAQLLGVSFQTVRRWEAGLSRPLPIISLKLEELQGQIKKAQHSVGGVSMSERKRESKEGLEIGLGGLFKGIGGLFDLVSRMTEEGQEEYTRSGEIEGLGGQAKGVYGLSIKVGLGGKPIIEQFGNIRATEKGAEVADVREPLVDVMDEGEGLAVIVELPGMEDDDIHVEIKEDVLILAAEGKHRKYSKEVLLPMVVETEPVERSYRNGILEVRLKKRG